jgi:O-antigen biosynthesis protein
MEMGDSLEFAGTPESLPADGERFLPDCMTGEIQLEHVHRYKFAAQLSAGKQVLDIACGEGYGSAYLAGVSRHVTGVDISPAAIAHARSKYRRSNLNYVVGSCTKIPLEDAAVDVVVSFETIEHIAEHEAMLREISRVLRPRGTLIISSPDRHEYSEKPGFQNPFHVKELYRQEFEALLSKNFRHARFFGQKVLLGSALFLETDPQEIEFHDTGLEDTSHNRLYEPRYWVAVASNATLRKVKGGVLEGDLFRHRADAEAAGAKSVAGILKAIADPTSAHLKEKLADSWYLERNQDVAARGIDPVEHWMNWGASEGRLPTANVESFARELVAEREQHLHVQLEAKDAELKKSTADGLAREQSLEEAQRRERATTHAEYEKREERVRTEFAEQQRRLSESNEALLVRQRTLESQLERAQVVARDQMEAELRALADRERAFAEQLVQQQRQASDEQAKDRQSNAALLQQALSQRDQTEQRLLAVIAERERELRNVQREAADQQKGLQAALAQQRIALRYASESHGRALSEQERSFQDKLVQQQSFASEEREIAARQIATARTDYEGREARIRAELEETRRGFEQSRQASVERQRTLESQLEETRLRAREEIEAQLRTLADRERAFSDRLTRQRDETEAQARTLADRERAFSDQLTHQRERAGQQLVETHARHREQILALESRLNALQVREQEQAAAQLKLLLEREHAFDTELSQTRELVEEERRLLRAQFLSATEQMRATLLVHTSRRPWTRNRSLVTELHDTWVSCAAGILRDQIDANTSAHTTSSVPASHAPPGARASLSTTAGSVADLLSREDHDFVSCMYFSMLGRKPDPKGYRFYLEQFRATGDKAEIIAQVAESPEAQQRKMQLRGLKWLIVRRKLARVRILGWLLGHARRSPRLAPPQPLLDEIGRRIAATEQALSQRPARPHAASSPDPTAYVSAVFASFDGQRYADANPDVATSGMNPYEHFVRFGWHERRALARAQGEARPNATADAVDVMLDEIVAQPPAADRWSCLLQPAFAIPQEERFALTRLMHFVWSSRKDLQQAFDVRKERGRMALLEWLAAHGLEECGLTAEVFPRALLEQLERVDGYLAGFAARALGATPPSDTPAIYQPTPAGTDDGRGANLVGYAFGEFGRGEDIRMVARSLDHVGVPFCIINQNAGLHGTRDASTAKWITDAPAFATNIFLINADLMPFVPFRLGGNFSVGRYNIGYWAWELAEWPAEFTLALDMVDEVWAISEFVAESVKTRARVPVVTMPNAVTVPTLGRQYTKSRYGLPPSSFVFYFIFDAASHIDRKNPIAVVRAFNLAFKDDSSDVHLLIKAMNVETAGALWREVLQEVAGSDRITVTTERMTREEVLGLHVACDALVSLHRSEGFGRCIAEAMAYGKPVIVTNYSGSRDFAREGTACVVDYRLVPVPSDSYPFSEGQKWAEPDVQHAAALMQRIARDESYRKQVAEAGQRFVLENFSEAAIGRLYAKRLSELGARVPAATDHSAVDDRQDVHADNDIFGNIDSPAPGCPEASDTLSIEGWATSRQGIDSIKVLVDEVCVAEAHYGLLRPDVHSAFPDFTAAGRSGFCLMLNVSDYADGDHVFSVLAQSRSGASKTWQGLFRKKHSVRYLEWRQRMNDLQARELAARPAPTGKVVLSLVLRLGVSLDRTALAETLSSLAGQAYPNLELLCVLGEEGQRSSVVDAARSAKLTAEPRCIVGESGDWTQVLSHCRGDFIGVAEVGDLYGPRALHIIENAISENDWPDLIYADEEIRGDTGSEPVLKPAWSPIFLDAYNYVGRPWFAARRIVQLALPGVTVSNPATEHELLKGIGARSSTVAHVPAVLVARAAPSSLQTADDRPHETGVPTLAARRYPKVAIVIPTTLGNDALVSRCFDALERGTDYPDIEVVVVVNNVKDPTATERHLAARPFRAITWNGSFNWSGINNFGAAHSDAELLLFMNDDIEPLGRAWLRRMVETLARTRAGVTGCLLKYKNDTIQHGGINFVNYGGGARHLFRFCTGDEERLRWLLQHPREVSAVTGACLLTTRECFNEVRGFDENLPLVGNDTDYCLRVWQSGRPVVFDPAASLIHYEGISRAGMCEVKDVATFWDKWRTFLERGDFFVNPNIDLTRDDWVVNAMIEKLPAVRTRRMTGENSGVVEALAVVDPEVPETADGELRKIA